MERYVVCVYRRDPADPKNIAGTVECGGRHGLTGFLGIDALVNILVLPGGDPEERAESPAKSERSKTTPTGAAAGTTSWPG